MSTLSSNKRKTRDDEDDTLVVVHKTKKQRTHKTASVSVTMVIKDTGSDSDDKGTWVCIACDTEHDSSVLPRSCCDCPYCPKDSCIVMCLACNPAESWCDDYMSSPSHECFNRVQPLRARQT
jgi:hypothetical protein